MMIKKLAISFAVLALSVASAETFRVTFFQPAVVQGTQLKPGDYSVDLENSKVVIKNRKQTVEAPVKVESVDKKYDSTTVRYASVNGKDKVTEIRLGGTKTKLVFNQ